MIKWASNTTRPRPLSLAGTRQPRPFRGLTPIRAVRRPSGITVLESAGAIAFALLMGIVGWAGTVVLLSVGR